MGQTRPKQHVRTESAFPPITEIAGWIHGFRNLPSTGNTSSVL
jgi:hypothetical protein